MKTLTLLRHAKSSWDDATSRDFDRPLNARGRRAAETIGRAMRSESLRYDAVIASPAVRVVETIDGVAAGSGMALAPHYDRRIYLASTAALLDLVHEADDAHASLMIVGHNPGTESLALLLSRPGSHRSEIEVKFPTGTLVEMRFDVARWSDVDRGGGIIVRFIRPRDLDPALGPEPGGW